MYPHSYSTTTQVSAPASDVFAFLDDHSRLASHMTRRSLAMGGGSMAIEADADGETRVGSRLRMRGTAFGIALFVEEVIVERTPPVRKVWETIGEPKLLVIGSYRMGFELEERGQSSVLRVFIRYGLPARAPWRWVGALFGLSYARWCSKRMANDAAREFRANTNGGQMRCKYSR